MRNLFRVLLVLYVVFVAACLWLILTDKGGGGPYRIASAMGAVGAGLPWTLIGFVVYPREAGPAWLYVLSTAGALVNLAVLAHYSGWSLFRRRTPP